MTHAEDWERHFKKVRYGIKSRDGYYEQILCNTCDSQGVIEVDCTPPDYWNTGPMAEEKPCDNCPSCEQCTATLNLDNTPRQFAIPIPSVLYQEEPGPKRDYIYWYFCGPGCLHDHLMEIHDPQNKWYNSKDSKIFRAFLYLILSGKE